MRKIAIVIVNSDNDSFSYDEAMNAVISNSISDWDEVSEKEYSMLHNAIVRKNRENYEKRMFIVERPDPKEFIPNTIKEQLAWAKKEEEKEEAKKRAAEQKKRAAALKRRAKTEAQELALFEELQKKYKK